MASNAEFPVSRPVEYVLNLDRPASLVPARTTKSYDRPESPSRSRMLAESRALSPSRSRVNSDRVRDSKTVLPHADDDHGSGDLTGSPRSLAIAVSSPSHSTSVTVKRTPFSFLYSPQSSSKERRQKAFTSTDFSSLSEAIWWIWGGSGFSGIVCMTLSSLAYSSMGLLVKLLSVQSVPSFETVFVRCAVIAVASFVGLKRMGYAFELSSTVRDLLVARAAVGYIALCGFLYSIHTLSSEDATVLNFTSVGVTAVLARVFLNENWAITEMAGLLCNFLGVVLVMQPTSFLGGTTPDGSSVASWVPIPTTYHVLSSLIALGAASLGAASFCLLRAIGRSGESPLFVYLQFAERLLFTHPSTIVCSVAVFGFSVLACPASLLCMLFFQTFVMPGIWQLLGMILVSLVAFLAQVLLARGLQLERAGRAASMLYLQVLLSHLMEVMFLGKSPSISGFLGVATIAVSTCFTTFCSGDRSQEHEHCGV